MCESTIASQTVAVQDNHQYILPSNLVSFERSGSMTFVGNEFNDAVTNASYTFCDDEVTFYSPGSETIDGVTEEDEEKNVTNADVQLPMKTQHREINNRNIVLPPVRTPEKNIHSGTHKNAENDGSIATQSHGNYPVKFKISASLGMTTALNEIILLLKLDIN